MGNIIETIEAFLGRLRKTLLPYSAVPLHRYTHIPEPLYSQLAESARSEEWMWTVKGNSKDYSPLKKYLQSAFVKLWRNGSVYAAENEEGNKYTCFNTGLRDKQQRPIYALFGENMREGKQPYFCYGFYAEGPKKNWQLITQLFDPLPPPPARL